MESGGDNRKGWIYNKGCSAPPVDTGKGLMSLTLSVFIPQMKLVHPSAQMADEELIENKYRSGKRIGY